MSSKTNPVSLVTIFHVMAFLYSVDGRVILILLSSSNIFVML